MTIPHVLGLLLAVTLPAGLAIAQNGPPPPPPPAGWVTVKTLGFSMALPGDYQEFYTFKKAVDKPHLGNWGFISPHGTRKIFVRVSELKTGTAEELLKKSEHHLARKVGELKKLEMMQLPKDELGRDGAIGFYKGVMHAISHKTQKLGEYHHLIIRAILRYPKFNSQLSVTHMVRGDKSDEAADFFMKQTETFVARDPAEAKTLAAPLLKKLKAAQKPASKQPAE